MNLKQIQEQPVRVRVIDNTCKPNEDTKSLIGKELEVRENYYHDKLLSVWNDDKSYSYYFDYSDVQFLLPEELKVEGKTLAIGDVIVGGRGEYEVYGYCFDDGEWVVRTASNFDYDYTLSFNKNDLKHFKFKSTDTDVDKAIKLLEEKGLLKDGKILSK